MKDQDVTFFKSHELGVGLPFAYTTWEQFKNSDDIFKPSLRDFHVIFWIKKGRGKYIIDFEEYTFEPQSLILVSKDQIHYFLPFEDDVELESLVFLPEFIYRSDSDLKHLYGFVPGPHEKGGQRLTIPKSVQPKLGEMSKALYEIYTSWDAVYQAKAFYHWTCLFLIQCEMLQEAQKTNLAADSQGKLLMQFTELLEQNFKTEFKVEFYADKLLIPLKALSKLTKDYYKMSPKSVIDQRRILEIKRQLKGTDKSGKTIAYELNFGEPTNMFKYFKKHEGITPNEFRAQKESR